MRIRVRVCGRTVVSLTVDGSRAQEDDPAGYIGGATLYTEIDGDPLVPEERRNHEYDDGFGFRRRY